MKFGIIQNRGCFGGCAFRALICYQGKQVRGRGRQSVVREAERLPKMSEFKGYIRDVGGPTANFTGPACRKQEKDGVCTHRDCLYPKPCSQLVVDHKEYLRDPWSDPNIFPG